MTHLFKTGHTPNLSHKVLGGMVILWLAVLPHSKKVFPGFKAFWVVHVLSYQSNASS